ncbi:hypothetical protein ACFUO0_20005 [Streptomyces cinereoruber]|uniref:hypothetical protein n=1 Tax=Streptomyces cinereoruber TaxID=67260 RepID=UPI0036435598
MVDHRDPEYWINRNMAVAEQLWLDRQEGLGGPHAEAFRELPPRAKTEAIRRRRGGETWAALLDELTQRHRP